jgi:hypothetical protein
MKMGGVDTYGTFDVSIYFCDKRGLNVNTNKFRTMSGKKNVGKGRIRLNTFTQISENRKRGISQPENWKQTRPCCPRWVCYTQAFSCVLPIEFRACLTTSQCIEESRPISIKEILITFCWLMHGKENKKEENKWYTAKEEESILCPQASGEVS